MESMIEGDKRERDFEPKPQFSSLFLSCCADTVCTFIVYSSGVSLICLTTFTIFAIGRGRQIYK